MSSPVVRRAFAMWVVGVSSFVLGAGGASAPAATEPIDPAQVVPLDQVPPEQRENVAEVIRDHNFHRKSEPESFPCHPQVYLGLLNEPPLTLALWQDLSTTPVALKQVGPNRYEGADGNGATASWEFVLRSPKLHVLMCNLVYQSPRGPTHVEARVVLLVHAGYYREANNEQWIKHDVEAFVKIDSKGWKTVARTFRPIIEKLLEDQVREAGWFVSLMGRLVAVYPNWAVQVLLKHPEINADTRNRFREVVLANKRPGAQTGRPVLADDSARSGVQRR